jgi:hypothetical protein
MNQALAFYAIRTVPGFPLGQPVDGRERYGMTPEQAKVYNWLVKNKPHDQSFGLNFRDAAWKMEQHYTNLHKLICALVERGWLIKVDAPNPRAVTYALVHPVMTFKAPRHA